MKILKFFYLCIFILLLKSIVFIVAILFFGSCAEDEKRAKEIYYFDRNNKLKWMEFSRKEGRMDGDFVCYFENGSKRQHIFFHMGKGIGYEFLENGKIRSISNYIEGTHMGFPMAKIDGLNVEYFPTGKVNFILNYKNGIRNGPASRNDSNGKLAAYYNYRNENWDGLFIEFDSTGKAKTISNYKNDTLLVTKNL